MDSALPGFGSDVMRWRSDVTDSIRSDNLEVEVEDGRGSSMLHLAGPPVINLSQGVTAALGRVAWLQHGGEGETDPTLGIDRQLFGQFQVQLCLSLGWEVPQGDAEDVAGLLLGQGGRKPAGDGIVVRLSSLLLLLHLGLDPATCDDRLRGRGGSYL